MEVFSFKNWRSFSNYQKLSVAFSLLMLLVLLVISNFHQMGGYGVETDFYWAYAPDAERIANGEMPQEPGVGPVYAMVLALVNSVIGDWFVSGKIISILSAILCGMFTFGFIKNLFDEKLAFFTLILWHVTVLPFSVTASTDIFFAFLVAASIFVFYRGGKISRSNLIFSGALMGVTYLTRHNAITLPLAVLLVVLLFNPEGWTIRQQSRNLLLFIAMFLFINLPWSVIQIVTGEGAVRSDSFLIIASNFYGRPGVVSSEDMRLAAVQFDSLWSVISYDFGHFVKHYFSNLYHHFYNVMIHSLRFPAFLFAIAGAVLFLPLMNRRQISLFMFPLLGFLLLCLVHYEPRYYLYLISFLILFVAYFLFGIRGWQEEASPGFNIKGYLNPAIYVATVLFLVVFSGKEIRANVADEPRELLKIANELQPVVEPGAAIIARKPHIGFLLDLETVYFPQVKTLAELLQFAVETGADYLIYGEMELQRRPELRLLLEPGQVSNEFLPLYVLEKPKTIVYKINYNAEEKMDESLGSY